MKNLLFIISLILLIGCKSLPEDKYRKITKNSIVFEGDLDELVNSSMKYSLNPGQQKRLRLEPGNPVVKLQDRLSNESFYSYFKLFKLPKNSESNEFQLEIRSLCDCLGFRKYIFIPELHVLDSTGTSFDVIKLIDREFNTGARYSLDHLYAIDPPNNGQYYLLLASYNMDLGQKIGENLLNMLMVPSGGSFKFIIETHSTMKGEFLIELKER